MNTCNDDVIHTIIICCNVKTIKNISCINNRFMKICNNSILWLQKFQHDNLPIIMHKSSMALWVKEYTKILILLDITRNIIELATKPNALFANKYVRSSFDKNRMALLPPELSTKITEKMNNMGIKRYVRNIIHLELFTENKYTIGYTLYHKNEGCIINDSVECSTHDIKQLLFKIMYYLPYNNIFNLYSYSWFDIEPIKILKRKLLKYS